MLTLTFTRSSIDSRSAHLAAREGTSGEWRSVFSSPFAGENLTAVLAALDPGFDPASVSVSRVAGTLRALGLPAGEGLPAAVGDALGTALRASSDIRAAIDTAVSAAQARREPLHLVLEFGPGCDEMVALPWELLRWSGCFLVADNSVILSRSLSGLADFGQKPARLPLRVLLVLSEPLGVSPITPERQARQLSHGLRALLSEGMVIVDELRPPTYDALVEAVRGGDYSVLHFYGHGSYRQGMGHLLFEDGHGGPDLVPAADVGAILNNSGVRLVVMGACQSAMGIAGQRSSVAAALLRVGVPTVVGMQVSLLVSAAQAFTRQFYLSLAAGKDVFQAMGDARLPLRRPNYGQSWFIPALYSRATTESRLFDPETPVAREAQQQIIELRRLQAQIDNLEEETGRLGAPAAADDVARLRAAQEQWRQAQATWNRQAPGGYQPVLSLLYAVPPQNPHFVGRVHALGAVSRALERDQPVVVWGLGGMGKTALAIEATRRVSWRYPGGILWLDCHSSPPMDTLLIQMAAFCGQAQVEELGPVERQAQVRALLSRLERCLLIWDSAEAVWDQRELRQFITTLPRNCNCLFTTRDDLGQTGWSTIELTPLATEETTGLFWALARAAGVKIVPDDWTLVPQIVDWLQGHPLALTLIVPLAKTRGLARLWTDLQRQPLKGITAALNVSVQRLARLSRLAFLRLSVFNIPFHYAAAEAVLPGEADLDEALDALVQRSLLTFDGRSYAYHPLVRQYAYDELKREEKEWRQMHHKAAAYLEAHLEEEPFTPPEVLEMVDQWEQAGEWRTFATHANALVGGLDRFGYWPQIEQRLARAREIARERLGDRRLEAQLLEGIGVMVLYQAQWDRAADIFAESERMFAALGDEQGVARVWCSLGNLAERRGDWQQAVDFAERSLAMLERSGNLPDMAKVLDVLGNALRAQRAWDRAAQAYRRSLDIEEKLGNMHGAAQTLNNLGLLYFEQGQWVSAREAFERCLQVHEHVGDLQGVAHACNNMGMVYSYMGEVEKALSYYRRDLQISEQLNDVAGIAQTWNDLGSVCLDTGEWDQAIEMFTQSLAVFERLGDVPHTAQAYRNLGHAHVERRDLERAEEVYRRSLALCEKLDDPLGMAWARAGLAAVCTHRGQLNQAQELYRDNLEVYQELGHERSIAGASANLANIYTDLGELTCAAEMYKLSMEAFTRLGDVHGAAQAQGNLALVYGQLGELDVALDLCSQSLQALEQVRDAKGIANSWFNMAQMHAARGDWHQAIEMYQRSLEIYEYLGDREAITQVLGTQWPAFMQQGNWDCAIEVCQKHIDILQHAGDALGVALALSNLGLAYAKKGELDLAAETLASSRQVLARLGEARSAATATLYLSGVYGQMGRTEEAKELLVEVYLDYSAPGSSDADQIIREAAFVGLVVACGSQEAAVDCLAHRVQ